MPILNSWKVLVIDKGIADELTHCLSLPARFVSPKCVSINWIQLHYKTVQIHTGGNRYFMTDQYVKGAVEML